MFKNLIFLLSFFIPFAAHSQFKETESAPADTPKTQSAENLHTYAIKTVYALEDSFLYKPGQYTTIDTSLNNIDLIDRGLLNGNFYQRINNFGSAAYNLEFSPIRTIGFNIGLINHRLHHFNSKQLRYYNSYTPYTQFRYIQGDGELQMLEIFHSQSITERLNLAVTYNSTISAGFYENEVNRLTNVGLHSHYVNKKGNYRLMLFGIWNTNSLDENGGIENVSDFDLDIYSTSRARISQSSFLESDYWFRNSSIGLRQMYYLGKQDSINVKGYGHDKRFLPRAYLTHKLIYEQNSTNYETADYDYFNNNYTFIEDVYENIEHRELSNELGIGLFFNKKEVLIRDSNAIKKPYAEQVFYGGLNIKLGRAGFWGLERLTYREPENLIKWWGYGNMHLFGNLSKKLTPVTYLKGSANYVLIGTQFSDYLIDVSLKQVLFKNLVLSPILKTQAVSPMFLQNTYVSTFARWNNDFKKEFNNSLGAELKFRENNVITVTANRSDNFIYYDSLAVPTQFESGINFLQIKIRKDLHLKKFHFENEVSWQQINDDSPYQIPNILAKVNWYFQTKMFKNALDLRLGFRAWYYSAYKGLNYMPGLGVFYVKNEELVGGVPWADVYVSANIKKWNGFVKYSHATEGLFGYATEVIPSYTLAPRALRMGVAWRFYD